MQIVTIRALRNHGGTVGDESKPASRHGHLR